MVKLTLFYGSNVDKFYKNFYYFKKSFVNGWGDPDVYIKLLKIYSRLRSKEFWQQLSPISMDLEKVNGNEKLYNCKFDSPLNSLLPKVLDENNLIARFQLMEPKNYKSVHRPLVIHFPRTGDQEYTLRYRSLGKPLLDDGVASLLYMNPFYGKRKPKGQNGSSLNYLSDLFVMGIAIILEAQFIINWAMKQGFYPIALHGISRGGHMSTISACLFDKPICNIPCLSWTSASTAFTKGVLSEAVDWKMLSRQYQNNNLYRNEIKSAIKPYQLKSLVLPSVESTTETEMMKPKSTNGRNISNLFTINIKEKFSNISDAASSASSAVWRFGRLEDSQMLHQLQSKIPSRPVTSDAMNDDEALEFFQEIMDYFTHLSNFPVPKDPQLTTFVVAEKDAFFPMELMTHIHDIWGPECQVRLIKGYGHVDSYLLNYFYKVEFREAILDTLNRYVELYEGEDGPFKMNKNK